MLLIIRKIFIVIFLFITSVANSQNDYNVDIKCFGTGKSIDEAKFDAMERSVNRVILAFLKITSVPPNLDSSFRTSKIPFLTSGIVNDINTIDTMYVSDTVKCVFLNLNISINNLKKYFLDKKFVLDLEGNEYTYSIQKNILNEISEIKNVEVISDLAHSLFESSFEFNLKSYAPDPLEGSSAKYDFHQIVYVKANHKIDRANDLLEKFLPIASLSPEELQKYKSLNKTFYTFHLKKKDNSMLLGFRRKESFINLFKLTGLMVYYKRRFEVKSEVTKSIGYLTEKIYNYGSSKNRDQWLTSSQLETLKRYPHVDITYHTNYDYSGSVGSMYLPSKFEVVDSFFRTESLTFEQIKKLKSFKISSSNYNIKLGHGGIILFEDEKYKFILSLYDIGMPDQMNSMDQSTSINNNKIDLNSMIGTTMLNVNLSFIFGKKLSLLGYDDWKIPNSDELIYIRSILGSIPYSGLLSTSPDNTKYMGFEKDDIACCNFHDNKESTYRIDGYHHMRLRLIRIQRK